jgi:DNA-binding CsgD family transcriptional regulator
MGPLNFLAADFRAVLAELPFAFYAIDRLGRFRWLNRAAAALIGDRVGEPFVNVVAPEHRHLARTSFARKIIGHSTTYDLTIVDRSNRRVAVRIGSTPLREADAVVGIVGMAIPLPGAAPTPPPGDVTLTPRQRETLVLLADGLSTSEIAARLGVADETARNHIRALLRQLGVHSRLEAVVAARRLGLLA